MNRESYAAGSQYWNLDVNITVQTCRRFWGKWYFHSLKKAAEEGKKETKDLRWYTSQASPASIFPTCSGRSTTLLSPPYFRYFLRYYLQIKCHTRTALRHLRCKCVTITSNALFLLLCYFIFTFHGLRVGNPTVHGHHFNPKNEDILSFFLLH